MILKSLNKIASPKMGPVPKIARYVFFIYLNRLNEFQFRRPKPGTKHGE